MSRGNGRAGVAGAPDAMRVLAYIRVSTDEQGRSGIGLMAQRESIEAECERRGWDVIEVVEDSGYSAKNLRRPGIARALELLSGGEADGLVVSKLDRLSRSMIDFTATMAAAQKQGWAIVALDAPVDTTTPAGEAMANVLATFAQFERRMIGQRVKETHAVQRARGRRMGRKRQTPDVLMARIVNEREGGATLQEIADRLNAEIVPTVRGGRCWYSATVAAVLRSAKYAAELGAV
jgi:DNA invertase Pin-like site-specific DNA recombinase